MFPHPEPSEANTPEPVRTDPNGFEQVWLTVDQAVAYCEERGLSRTPKTVRKWAERSSGLADGDVISRKEDTAWGSYRWLIEQASLSKKVEEELELRAANQPEPVHTSSNNLPVMNPIENAETLTEPSTNLAEQVQTSAHPSEPVSPETTFATRPEPGANGFEPVQSGTHTEKLLEEVRERLADKDNEIAFLREQLAAAQAEVGERATSTDAAIKSLDRVVRSFELQAEANRTRALGIEAYRDEEGEIVQSTPLQAEPMDSGSRRHDIHRV